MKYEEMGLKTGKTLMLLPGTCCDYQTNFANVLPKLSEKYHLICVNYDGLDGGDEIFPDMITVTEKIEKYIIEILVTIISGLLILYTSHLKSSYSIAKGRLTFLPMDDF